MMVVITMVRITMSLITNMVTSKSIDMSITLIQSPKLIYRLVLMSSLIMTFGCDDDDDDSSYGVREEIREELPELSSGEEIVMYKA